MPFDTNRFNKCNNESILNGWLVYVWIFHTNSQKKRSLSVQNVEVSFLEDTHLEPVFD